MKLQGKEKITDFDGKDVESDQLPEAHERASTAAEQTPAPPHEIAYLPWTVVEIATVNPTDFADQIPVSRPSLNSVSL